VGSTKDRDNSNSSSVGSSNSLGRGPSDGSDHSDDRVAYIDDNIENKTYLIKTTGTIVDVTRKRKKMRKIPMSVKKPVSQYVAFIKSPFKGRPPVVFFPYPSYVGDKKEEFGRVFFKPQEDLGPLTLRFKIAETTNIYNALVNSCKAAGMYLVGEKEMLRRKRKAQGYDTSSSEEEDEEDYDEDDFNLLVSGGIKEDVLQPLRSYQRINHFPNSFNLGRKDAMYNNIAELRDQYPEEYDFCPRTYVFPEDAEDFENARLDPDNDSDMGIKLWIFKPSASSCGKGIRIVSKHSPIPKIKKGFVISEYVANPHLIEGLKYDLRVYVLVTSYNPLIIYIYNDGLARFATEKYTLDEEQFENRFVHLTNYSINKKNEVFIQNKTKTSTNLRASKWSLKTLEKVFEDHNKDFQTIKKRMRDLIIKTIISVEGPIMESYESSTNHANVCFELYGFDILIDSNLKPWILEVNISPSLSSSSPFDKTLKTMLVCDALTIVGIKPTNHEKYVKDEFKSQAKGEDAKIDKSKQKNINNIDSEKLDNSDIDLILSFEEQVRRSQNFELIFPIKQTFKKYIKFFSEKRYNNYFAWNHIKEPLIDVETLLNS